MELYQLQYALAVDRHRSFSRAADACNITPSALSQQIRKLEQELGVALFTRTTRTVETTPAGRSFLQTAEGALAELERARDDMRAYARAERGGLHIGCFPALGAYGVTPCITAFQKSYPNVQLTLLEAECLKLLDMLEDHSLDAAFMTAVTHMRPKKIPLEAYPVATSELILEVSQGHPFAGRKSVEWIELADEKILSPPAFSGVRLDMDEACRQAGFTPSYLSLTGSSDTVSAFAAAGLGVSVTSIHAYKKASHEGTVPVPLTPKAIRTVYFVLPGGTRPSPLLDNFKVFSLQWGQGSGAEPIYMSP